MAKRLGSAEARWSRAVLHDIFEAGGIIKYPKRTYKANGTMYRKESAEVICKEIKFREFNFTGVDNAIRKIAYYSYFYDLHGTTDTKSRQLNEAQIAHILAAFCAENGIFWDDVNTSRTTVEMETYTTKTIFGAACWAFECFLSQQADKKTPVAKSAASRGASASRTTGGGPTSGYKSSGPKSSLVVNLVGKPGEKIHPPKSTPLILIRCTSDKPKKQYVYINPLRTSSVSLGDPSGYSDCKLFFKTISDAQDAIRLIKSGTVTVPSHITDFSLEKQAVDSNGYFEVETNVGNAYIKASKLNEAIEEDLDECSDSKTAVRTSRFPEIMDIDVYTEALYRE
jgi:hypothetical protein